MSTNCVGTYEQYKERLLKMKPNVYLHGQKIDRSNGKQGAERDLADWIQGGTYVMKQCYDTANDPHLFIFSVCNFSFNHRHTCIILRYTRSIQ